MAQFARDISIAAVALVGLMLVPHNAARAQIKIDLATVTCEQLYKQKLSTARYVGVWLSGFQQSKRNDTVIDPSSLRANASKLTAYCVRNPKTLIFQAVEDVFGQQK